MSRLLYYFESLINGKTGHHRSSQESARQVLPAGAAQPPEGGRPWRQGPSLHDGTAQLFLSSIQEREALCQLHDSEEERRGEGDFCSSEDAQVVSDLCERHAPGPLRAKPGSDGICPGKKRGRKRQGARTDELCPQSGPFQLLSEHTSGPCLGSTPVQCDWFQPRGRQCSGSPLLHRDDLLRGKACPYG